MIKSEVTEIKKRLSIKKQNVQKIAYVYVNHEKNILGQEVVPFLQLQEEDIFKFLEIGAKTLSGKIGKNLVNLEFSTETENNDSSFHALLMKLHGTMLNDDEVINEFAQKIIGTMDYGENFVIILYYSVYDVPKKATDGAILEDSEEMYGFLNCAICPVKTEKAGMFFNVETGKFESKKQRFCIEPPMNGFLFPAFTDRREDIHSLLYYAKKPEEMHKEIVEMLMEEKSPMSSSEQKSSFEQILDTMVEGNNSFDTIKEIRDQITSLTGEGGEPQVISKEQVRNIFHSAGVQNMDTFDKVYEASGANEGELLVTNIIDSKNFAINMPNVKIKIDGDRTDLVSSKMVDGEKCLVIRAENVEVNGILVN